MKKKALAWTLLLVMCIAGGALAGGEQSWHTDAIGLTLQAPAGFAFTNPDQASGHSVELKNESLGEDIVYQMVATSYLGVEFTSIDDIDEAYLCSMMGIARGENNYACYFEEISAKPYMVAEQEDGTALLALTVHDKFACLFSVRSTGGKLPQAAKDGLMEILGEATYE